MVVAVSVQSIFKARICPVRFFHPQRESHHSLSSPTSSSGRDGFNVPLNPPKPVDHEIHTRLPLGAHAQRFSMRLPLEGRLFILKTIWLRSPSFVEQLKLPWNKPDGFVWRIPDQRFDLITSSKSRVQRRLALPVRCIATAQQQQQEDCCGSHSPMIMRSARQHCRYQGVSTSLRFSFAKIGVDDCNRDITTVVGSVPRSKTTEPLGDRNSFR